MCTHDVRQRIADENGVDRSDAEGPRRLQDRFRVGLHPVWLGIRPADYGRDVAREAVGCEVRSHCSGRVVADDRDGQTSLPGGNHHFPAVRRRRGTFVKASG